MSPRHTLRTLCVAGLAAFAACDSATEATRDGRFAGTWGGGGIEGGARALLANDSLYVTSVAQAGGSELHVGLAVGTVDAPGSYLLTPGTGRVAYVIGGDGIVAEYVVMPDLPGTLTITEVKGGYVRGRVSFIANARHGLGPVGAQSRLEGEFSAAITRP